MRKDVDFYIHFLLSVYICAGVSPSLTINLEIIIISIILPGWNVVLYTRRFQVRFLVREHTRLCV